MSFTKGQLFGAVLGAVIAFFLPPVGYIAYTMEAAAAGFSIGFTIGGIIDPPPRLIVQEGPRLGDLSAQTSEWGRPIPVLFGTYKMAGNVFWALPLHETKHVDESGEGKGGGATMTETTWYSYAGSWAVGFCEGPVEKINKIWFDSVLVYDGISYSGGLTSDNYTVYFGTSDQPIDWYMQSENPDSPAYRHLAYIVFNKIELENYGNKMPSVAVEISQTAGLVSLNSTVTDIPNHWGDQSVLLNVEGNSFNTLSADYDDTYTDVNWKNYVIYKDGIDSLLYTTNDSDLVTTHTKTLYGHSDSYSYLLSNHPEIGATIIVPNNLLENKSIPRMQSIITDIEAYECSYYVYTSNSLYIYVANDNRIYNEKGDSVEVPVAQHPTSALLNRSILTYYNGKAYLATIKPGGNELIISSYDSYTGYLDSETFTLPVTINDEYTGEFFVDSYGFHYFKEYYHIIIDTDNVVNAQALSNQVNTTTRQNSYMYKQDVLYHMNNTAGDWTLDIWELNSSEDATTLETITTSLLERAGLSVDDYDTTEGVDIVNGFIVTHPMSTRAAISPVTSAYKFDIVETDFKINIKKRNTTPIATLTDFIDFVKIDRIQTIELSKSINILYANRYNNYDPGSQNAMRADIDVTNIKTYQYPLALSDDEAKQIAEIYLYSEWNQRLEFEFTIPFEALSTLVPSNVIDLKYEGHIFTVRLTEVIYTSNNLLECKASIESTDVYVSNATGSNTAYEYVRTEVRNNGLTRLELLDIPMLTNIANYEGIYLAANGYLPDWTGCLVDKSTDGLSYNKLADIFGGTALGETTTVLLTGPTTVYDKVNTVTIRSIHSIFAKNWEDLLVTSSNYILIGNEVLQYADAFNNGDGTYTLSNLLRGRRGTEWAINTHEIGELFVLLDSNMIFDSTASLFTPTYYRGTTFGAIREKTPPKYIVPEIRCLKPLSPSYVKAIRDESYNIIITWHRRSRDVTGYLRTLELFEETEAYSVEIETGLGRTINVTSETATYTALAQLNDGITLGNPVTFSVYQISGIVGKGYGTQETI